MHMRGTRKEKRRWIFVLQTSNKTEFMCPNVMKYEKEKRIFMWRHVVTTTSAICGVHPEYSRPKPVGNLTLHTDLL
jgi:hypothetical protein